MAYIRTTGPEVPAPDMTVAKIVGDTDLAGSYTRGLAAMGQLAAARQRAQLEAEQMATDAALKSRQLDIARENNLLDFQVGIKQADALANYRNTMASFESDPGQPGSKAWRINNARLKEMDFADFNKEVAANGLLEPNPKNPVQFYLNKQHLHDNWQFATDSRIRDGLKALDQISEQYHTVALREGMQEEIKNGKATGKFLAAGDSKQVPIGRIIDQLNDPAQVDATFQLLERNGLATKEIKNRSWVHADPIQGRLFGQTLNDWLFGKKTQKETTETLSPSLGKYMEMGKGADFSRGKPRQPRTTESAPTDSGDLPTGITQDSVDEASAAAGNEAPLPAPAGTFAPTEKQKIVATARRYYNMPGADKAAIRARLQNEYHIDPAQLDKPE